VFDIQPTICPVEAALAVSQLEPLLGFALSKNAMPRRGYDSREQFVRDITAQLETVHAKQKRAHRHE